MSRRLADIFPKRCEQSSEESEEWCENRHKILSGKLAKLLQFSFEELTLTLDFWDPLSLYKIMNVYIATWMQKDVGFYALAAANQQVAKGVKIVREA